MPSHCDPIKAIFVFQDIMAGSGIEVRICLWKVSTVGRHDCWKLSQSSLCLGLKCKRGKMLHKNIISGNVSLFARFKKHRKYGKVSSFEGPIILKKDLQVIEVKYINVHCESVLLTLQ